MHGSLGTIHPGAVVENRQWMDWGRYNKIDDQGRSDFSLFRWVEPTPIHNEWTIIEYPPRGLRSSARIEEEGRGSETRLANIGFRSQRIRRLCEEPAMRGIYVWGSHQDVLVGVAQSASRPRTMLNC